MNGTPRLTRPACVLDCDAAWTSHPPSEEIPKSVKHERKGRRDAPCACCAPSAFPRTRVETLLPDSTSAPARRARRLSISIPGERAFDSLPRPMWCTRRIAFRPLCTHTVHGIRLCSSSALVASSSADRSLSSQTVTVKPAQARSSHPHSSLSFTCRRKSKEGTHLSLSLSQVSLPHRLHEHRRHGFVPMDGC
jgi:hypothetical protein